MLGRTYNNSISKANDGSLKKRRYRPNPTKKINCPAKMVVKCFTVFTQDHYKAKALKFEHGARELRKIIKQLKKDLQSSSPPTGTMRFMIVMSPPEGHNHTTVSNEMCGILHPRLREEIHNFVRYNICSTKTMKIHLEEVVQQMFNDEDRPKPNKLNRSYYPNDQVIRYHMQKALDKVKLPRYDQDALEASIETWQCVSPDDKFKFRACGVEPHNEVDGESVCPTLLFCHQTKWQQDLLARYGNNICLLDAAYKTTKYDLPLFFIVVKTNSGYCIVGTFVVQSESSTLIAEALSQFKEWNSKWKPMYFMTDNSETEINALEKTFPKSTIYFCSFHRQQSWHIWLTKKGIVTKGAIAPLKKLWGDIAASHTGEECTQNLSRMYNDSFYKNSPNAQEYFTREWLPVKVRWVSAYQAKDFLSKVNTNNGVESQNKMFEHLYLKQNKGSTLTDLIRMLIQLYLPEMLSKYIEANAMLNCNFSEYNEHLPEFLKNRPVSFRSHVSERYERGKEYDCSDINYMGEAQFLVRSELQADAWYTVDIAEGTCLCFDFEKWRFPCKHMCAVFIHTEWGFDQLPQAYRESPYLTLDTNYTTRIQAVIEVQDLETNDTETNMSSSPTIEEEAFDIKKARLQLQKNLEVMTGYSYLSMTPKNLKKMLDASEHWKQDMMSAVATYKEALLLSQTEENTPEVSQLQQLKNVKKKYVALPKRIRQKDKNKCAGSAGAQGDGQMPSATSQAYRRMPSATTLLGFTPETCQDVKVDFIVF